MQEATTGYYLENLGWRFYGIKKNISIPSRRAYF